MILNGLNFEAERSSHEKFSGGELILHPGFESGMRRVCLAQVLLHLKWGLPHHMVFIFIFLCYLFIYSLSGGRISGLLFSF